MVNGEWGMGHGLRWWYGGETVGRCCVLRVGLGRGEGDARKGFGLIPYGARCKVQRSNCRAAKYNLPRSTMRVVMDVRLNAPNRGEGRASFRDLQGYNSTAGGRLRFW